ncbi:MAG: peptide/nickel transport system substrate-binding protein, partial [Chloroflexota bacterium]|nr:peptide/nickel transport system substrate-binding protein [Chloroflexota bacterium]
HDGTPLVADDFVFGQKVASDLNFLQQTPPGIRLISNVEAPDPQTVVVNWKQTSIDANAGTASPALPRRLLGELYDRGDPQAFQNGPYWSTAFVGLGPYKMVAWQPGGQMEGEAFDKYFLGRPKIDRLIVKYLDPEASVLQLMSGDLDIVPAGASLDGIQMYTVAQGFQSSATGNTVVSTSGDRYLAVQFRDPATPWARDVRVRQALALLSDSKALVESTAYNMTTVADMWIPADDPVHQLLLQRQVASYPYDPTRAARVLADAGWTLSPSHVFQNAAGEPLTITVSVQGRGVDPKEGEALAGQYSGEGLNSPLATIPSSAPNVDELNATYPALLFKSWSISPANLGYWTKGQTATAETRWKGGNVGAYFNPEVDRLYDRYLTTLDLSARQSAEADLVKLYMDDLPSIPLYYRIGAAQFRSVLHGPGKVSPSEFANSWNISTWTMD